MPQLFAPYFSQRVIPEATALPIKFTLVYSKTAVFAAANSTQNLFVFNAVEFSAAVLKRAIPTPLNKSVNTTSFPS